MKKSIARKKERKLYMNTYGLRAAQRAPWRVSEITENVIGTGKNIAQRPLGKSFTWPGKP